MLKTYRMVFITAITVIVLDQISKAVIAANFDPYRATTVIPGFFNIVNWRNPGAAFGMFGSGGSIRTVVLSLLPLIALVVIGILIKQSKDKFVNFALALIAGGAVGNLIDRVRFGEVIDFLDFYIGNLHWPAFNVADSAITVGVVMAIIGMYVKKPASAKQETVE